MKIFVLNSGSSSIKYQLIEMPQQDVICSGLIERIGIEDSIIHYNTATNKIKETIYIANHNQGLKRIVAYLLDKKVGVLNSADDIIAIGHRVVHGGSAFSKTVIINQSVKNKIRELFSLAPLHNPPNLEGIEVAEELFPKAVQIAVFDTAFHQTIPEKAYKYAIPTKFYKENKIRLYGFHGTSHKYVSEKANEYLKRDTTKIITIHLGNGCSITAVKNGKSIDHSLGFGPVNGLIMGTRSGDIDQSIIFYLVNSLGYSLYDVSNILQKGSGMLGLTGYSDLRDIESKANLGDKDCKIALEMNAYRIKKYIGAYTATMNGLDAIVFTAGIGENSSTMRSLVCKDLEYLGLEMDTRLNNDYDKSFFEINTQKSKCKILVIPTNEELEIAEQSYKLIS